LPGPGTRKSVARVLVAEGMTADHDRLGQPGTSARHVAADDRLAEDGSAQDVADRPVGDFHIFFSLNSSTRASSGVIGRAFDADSYFRIAVSRNRSSPCRRCGPALPCQIVIMQIDIEIGQDQLVPDRLPDHARHFVAIELDNGFQHLDLRHHIILRQWRQGRL